MKKTTTKIICDVCKKDVYSQNNEYRSGEGSLKFKWALGGNGGGWGDTINYEDICCICTEKLLNAIREVQKGGKQ